MSNRGSSNCRVPVVIGLFVFLVVGLYGVTAPAVRAAPGDVGQAGPSFVGSGADPTGTKPESKVWYNDGFWWASMYNASASAFTIHRLSGTTWTNTGVVIDGRENTHQDALWDQAAGKLYVASHVYDVSPQPEVPRSLYRFSYNAGSDTYALDGVFPRPSPTGDVGDPRHRQGLHGPAVGDMDPRRVRPGQPDDQRRPDMGHRVRPGRHQHV